MNRVALVLAGFGAAILAQPASAITFLTGSGSLTTTDPVQVGRVTRDGVASTWAAPKTYPGSFDTTAHQYDLVNATFASNAVQTIYYEISFTNPGTAAFTSFSVAYLNSFNPANIATNYLGDAGSTPIAGTSTYQVIVPVGQRLILNFHQVVGLPVDYGYSVAAFSDANRGETFLPVVPEPATWGMTILGFGLVGGALRRRRSKGVVRVAFA